MSTETRKKGGDLRSVFAHISIYIAALLFASPLIYALFSAMKPNNEMFTSPPRLIGSQIKWTNFIEVFSYGPFVTYMLNSLFVSVVGTILVLIVSSTSAFAFARLRWKGRDAVFLLFLATLMVPAEVVMIPMYTLMDWFGWINTYQALIIPFAFSAFGTFLLRQFYRGIPFERTRPPGSTVRGRCAFTSISFCPCRVPRSRCWPCSPSWASGTPTCGR